MYGVALIAMLSLLGSTQTEWWDQADETSALATMPLRSTEPCADSVTVLFVGNSRLYYHNQPAMVAGLAEANGCVLTTKMVVEGGATLRSHTEAGEALAAIEEGGWDFVVFNEQSTWGEVFMVDGVDRVREPPVRFFDDLRRFADAVEANGAEPLFLLHPRRRDAPAADVHALEDAGRVIERDLGIRVIPLAGAWEDRSLDDAQLYDPDGSHPSPVGALLSATAIYATIFEGRPDEVPVSMRGAAVGLPNGTLFADSIVDLVNIGGDVAIRIATASEEARARWGRGEPTPVTADEDVYPQLPESPADSKAADLVGTWSGELKLYPRYLTWPATLRLVVREEAERLSAEFRVSFGGRPTDIVYPQLPISFEDSYFQFVDPDGPNGGFVRYRIVVESASSAVGIAEFITDRAVYGLGSVQLRR